MVTFAYVIENDDGSCVRLLEDGQVSGHEEILKDLREAGYKYAKSLDQKIHKSLRVLMHVVEPPPVVGRLVQKPIRKAIRSGRGR